MTDDRELWAKGRDSLVETLDADRPLDFCWGVFQIIIGQWQTARGVSFAVLPDCNRAAMRQHLLDLD
jgi:hypothetical protein